jgi:regulator of sigma E protease
VHHAGAKREPLALADVPSCGPDGAPAVLLADPMVAAYVAAVEPGSPAERAGLARGDRITSVAGKAVRSVRDLDALSAEFVPARSVTLGLDDGRTLSLTPGAEGYRDEATHEQKQRPVLGFKTDDRAGIDLRALVVERIPLERSVLASLRLATAEVGELIRMTVIGLGKIGTGDISFRQVGGPIRLFSIAAEAAEAGLSAFLLTMGLVSVNLGLMNLLPIPVLDGGHILTAVIEGVTRRRLSFRVREVANWVGLVLILALMIFVMGNDIIWKWG